MASAIDELSDYVVEIFDKCEERGMQVPFIVCAVSPNGSMVCARVYRDGGGPDILAEHFEAEGYRLPMTCMVVDQNNEAARVTIAPGNILQFDRAVITFGCGKWPAHSSGFPRSSARLGRDEGKKDLPLQNLLCPS